MFSARSSKWEKSRFCSPHRRDEPSSNAGLAGPLPAGPLPAGPLPAGPLPAGPLPAGPPPAGPLPAGPLPAGTLPAGQPDAPHQVKVIAIALTAVAGLVDERAENMDAEPANAPLFR